MYARLPSFVLGFHGCEREVGERILAGHDQLQPSQNQYDWLGPGAYFWENNAKRALSYARTVQAQPNRGAKPINDPFVIGAVIDLGYCLNLTDESALELVKNAYDELESALKAIGARLPVNKGGDDMLLRQLDCAVFRALHKHRELNGEPPFDSIRSPFIEGSSLYEGTLIKQETHLQISVLKPSCIKGYFRPLKANGLPFQEVSPSSEPA